MLLSATVALAGPAAVQASEGASDQGDNAVSPSGGGFTPSPYAAPAPPAAPGAPSAEAPALGPAAPPAPVYERDEDAPLAGYTNNAPFIRSRDSNFVIFPSGRFNVDGFFFLNRGDPPTGVTPDSAGDSRPRNTIFLRRARAEIMGTVLKHFDYMLAGEFATTPSGAQSATATDVFINVNYTPWANIQIGQYDAPFTMENRISDKYIDFMERSITARAFGIPQNKDVGIMITGLAPKRFLHYELGVFNGDGMDVRNPDSHFDFMGRAYFAPLALLSRASTTRWLSEIWIGGSLWYGQRVDVDYTAPALTTQGGVTLLPSTFNGGLTLVPNGDLLKWAIELNVPVGPIGWRFELVRTERENLGVYRPSTAADGSPPLGRVNIGAINRNGYSLYAQMWYWILGSPSMLPTPGQEIPPRWVGYKKGKESWPIGLYISARYERMLVYQDDVTQAPMMLTSAAALATKSMSVDSFGLALNAWFTRHMRFSINYLLNYLDGDMGLVQGGAKLAAPGTTGTPTGLYYQTAEHELLFRAAMGL